MTSPTYKKVNAAIFQYGVELVKGNGYHYFSDLPGSSQYTAMHILSVFDGGFLRSMSLEDWVEYVKDAVNNMKVI